MAQQARLLAAAQYPVTIIAGRGSQSALPPGVALQLIPELDSEYAENQAIARALEKGEFGQFEAYQQQIEHQLTDALINSDIVVAHNVFNTHFNLSLTAALHRLLERGALKNFIAWCHDISRYVNPDSGFSQRTGFPWDLLRTHRSDVTYVTVSARRRQALAKTLGCSPSQIQHIPNGLEPATLLGLSEIGLHFAATFGLFKADLVVLMPIRITKIKNIELALKVTAALKTLKLNPRLIVSGPPDPHAADIGQYFDDLRALRHSLNIDQEAIFIYEGTSQYPSPLEISAPIVAELYRLCDVVMLPSLREGFGIPVLEAGLLDKPIFTSAVPAVDEVGEKNVYLIQPDESPESVAARLCDWAKADVTHQLRRRVRQNYLWSAIFAEQIEPLITSLHRHGRQNA